MQGAGAKLTAKQERAIAALLAHSTIEAAASSLGVNAATVYRWLGEPCFVAAYRGARRRAVEQAIARLQQVSSAAVAVLLQVAGDKGVNASTRVAAASKILDLSLRAVEIEDIQARLEALEQAAGSTP